MTSPDALAALHATCFSGSARWSPAAFAEAHANPSCFFIPEGGSAEGFALGRVIEDEAELLTLVVPLDRRGRGQGRRLLSEFETESRSRGATTAFLEVSADNLVARTLYLKAGWQIAGKRKDYYGATDALALRKDLAANA